MLVRCGTERDRNNGTGQGGGGGVWCEVRQGLGDRIVLAWNEPQPPSLMCGWRSAVVHKLV